MRWYCLKLSIIVISYNEKEYISEAIESCLNQNFVDSFEIIIGDDGSSDGSISVIKSYVEKYPNVIKYFIMDRSNIKDVIPSIRVSNIIKKGLDIAKGQYLMILSGDDFFCDRNKFSKQIQFLDNNSQYVACYSDFTKFWSYNKKTLVKQEYQHSNATFWSGCYVHISSFAFRNNIKRYLLEF